MSPLGQTHLQEISIIADALSNSECRKLIYLCESLETECSPEVVKETLKSKVESHDNAPLFLKALISHLGRYDILRKVYKVGRAEIDQQLQTHDNILPTFRVLMLNISEEMLKRDVEGIKFLLGNKLPREKIENSQSFLDVLVELEKLDSVSPDRVDVVEKCLLDIGRVDLVKKVDAYKMPAGASAGPSSQQQSCQAANFNARQPVHQAAKVNMPLPVFNEPVSGSPLEEYKFTTNPRGVCVIIDCEAFDGEMLRETFKALHFHVVYRVLLVVEYFIPFLKAVIKYLNDNSGDAFVCCVISRGTTHHLLGSDMDEGGMPLAGILSLFMGDACPTLVGKPKLFFIQRYNVPEVNQDNFLETDGCSGQPTSSRIPTDADTFWSHCWTDERQLQQPYHHSVYLKALDDALHKAQCRKTNLVDLHMEVNGAVFEHNERHPEEEYSLHVKHTLRKNLYLQ